MTTELLLFITLIIYLIGLMFAMAFDKRTMLFVSILWLVPLFTIEDQPILHLFSIIMFLLHIIIPVLNMTGGKDDFI